MRRRPAPGRGPRWLGAVVALLGVLRAGLAAGAPPPCDRACGEDVACLVAAARCHLDAGRPRRAIELLRPRRGPQAPAVVPLLLARAYLAEKNSFWALRVLHESLAFHPDRCETRGVLAWLYLRDANLERAREVLAHPACPGTAAPPGARAHLLAGLIAAAAGDRAAAVAGLTAARRQASLFAEDRALLDQLRAQVEAGWLPPLSLRAEVALGWTSNGLQSSPTDPGAAGAVGRTPVGGLDVFVRFVPPLRAKVRPVVEAQLRGLGLLDGRVRELSYLSLTGRPGLLLGRAPPRLLLAYSGQWLLLAGSDLHGGPPRWFYESHRAEAELELPRGVTLFGGGGKVRFREAARSRAEADLGVGLHLSLGRVQLLGALSGRVHRAAVAGYDLWGGSLLTAATVALGRGFTARASLVLGLDYYSRSRDYFGVGRDRRDLAARLSVGAFSPPWRGVTVGAAYEPAVRSSTVAVYAYSDHRLLVKLRWQLELDPWAPRAVTPDGHVSFWGRAAASGLASERIQDLLRQEDAARRGSSCVQ